jgi:biotin carboxylase
VILKPADRQGSVGAVILRDPAGLDRAWAASQLRDEGVLVPDRAPSARTLVEELVVGPEYSVEALVREGRILFANVTAKELFPGPHPVERAHTVPAPLAPDETERLVAETGRVLAATGFRTGIVHCEWIRAADGPVLVECAGRFAGDGIIDLVCRAWGFDIVAAYHALMRGEDPGVLPTRPSKTASVRFLGGRDGILVDVAVEPGAMAQEGVVAHHVSVQPGARTFVPAMSWHRLASVTVEASDPEAARVLAERALAGIRLDYAAEAAA